MKTVPDIIDLAVNAFSQGDEARAQRCYEQARSLDSNHSDFARYFYNIGTIFQHRGKYGEAEKQYRQSLAIHPDYVSALNNLSTVLYLQGNLTEAGALCRRIIELDPSMHLAHNNLGSILRDQAEHSAAIEQFRRSTQLQPDYLPGRSNYLISMLYDADMVESEILSAHKSYGGTGPVGSCDGGGLPAPDRRRTRPLRVGYVSPDFKTHSVAYFVAPILANHNRERFEVYCYSDVANPDPITHRFSHMVDVWRDTHELDNVELRKIILQDGIDVLVDLAGHGNNNRLPVFAMRSAHVQVTYLGYPYTTGVPQMDYRIVDEKTDPSGAQEWCTERLLRLSGGFLSYVPPPDAPEASPALPAMKNGHITFGSFNNPAKVNDRVIRVWSEILRMVPQSHLRIKAKPFRDQAIREKFEQKFAGRGIDVSRLEFVGHAENTQTHLAMYDNVDIALDTFPYNGTTTTCEAIWMGVPVVSLQGTTHRGRVGLSLLSQIGLPTMAAKDIEQYKKLAQFLAQNLERLSSLRKSLRATMAQSPLCDGAAFTKRLEMAYMGMWQEAE